jgi:hypothetical protein
MVLMLLEILHTLRIWSRSQVPVTEPFRIVGLIGSTGCILVIILEAATLTREAGWAIKGERFQSGPFMRGKGRSKRRSSLSATCATNALLQEYPRGISNPGP